VNPKIEEKEMPRPVRKIGEHLEDASFHLTNILELNAEQKKRFIAHLDAAWKIVKEVQS
jgi:hypothetical protein